MNVKTILSGSSLLLAALLGACGSGSSSDSSFEIRTTTKAAESTAPLVVAGNWMVYFAREQSTGPAGTDLNNDGVIDDQVAFAVNLAAPSETNLGVAARGAVIVGNEIYLKVVESEDGVDWSGGGLTETVLLHWNGVTGGTPTFVDVLDLHFPEEMPVAVGTRLFYAAVPPGPLGTDETSLRTIDTTAPTTPVTVLNQIGGGALHAHLYGAHEGLVFAFVDENDDGVILNGDGAQDDEHVLALLDGTRASERMKVVGLALGSDSEPFATHSLGANDWTAAFLVDEASQGISLNNQNLLDGGNPVFTQPLLPNNCAAVIDLDTTDQVLHYVKFASFLAGTSAPVNTGLVGHDRVLAFGNFVATLSDEVDANCNLNNQASGDADSSDDVLRWVATTLPNAPEVDGTLMHAIADSTSGGSRGVATLDDRLVAVVDEAADDGDYDAQAGEIKADHDLIAWLDPALANPVWHFSHQSSTPGIGTGLFDSDGDSEPFAGTSWMAPEAVGGRLALVFLEEVPGATNPHIGSLNTNLDCNFVVKDNDKSDGLPVWADFEAGPTLDFDGMGYAVDKANAGIEIAAGFAFFRVSENNDNRDYNDDHQTNDVVVFRNPLTACDPVPLATASVVAGQVIVTDRVAGAAFFSDEAQANIDFNGDNDKTDLVVRYFHF